MFSLCNVHAGLVRGGAQGGTKNRVPSCFRGPVERPTLKKFFFRDTREEIASSLC